MTYKTTHLFDFSLVEYIGETTIVPTVLFNAIHLAYYGKVIEPWTMYYYGEPDAELNREFGYSFHKFVNLGRTQNESYSRKS